MQIVILMTARIQHMCNNNTQDILAKYLNKIADE
jgi:hypothetical protein